MIVYNSIGYIGGIALDIVTSRYYFMVICGLYKSRQQLFTYLIQSYLYILIIIIIIIISIIKYHYNVCRVEYSGTGGMHH